MASSYSNQLVTLSQRAQVSVVHLPVNKATRQPSHENLSLPRANNSSCLARASAVSKDSVNIHPWKEYFDKWKHDR